MFLFLYWLYSIILLCFLYIKIHSFCTYIQTCYISVQYTRLPSWEVAPERNLTSFTSWLPMYITLHLIGCFWIELHRLLFVTKTSNETSFILLLISPLLLFSIFLSVLRVYFDFCHYLYDYVSFYCSILSITETSPVFLYSAA